MTLLYLLAISLCGGLGAAGRYSLDTAIKTALTRRFSNQEDTAPAEYYLPLGIVVVNLSGCFLAGLVVGWSGPGGVLAWNVMLGGGAHLPLKDLLAIGFLGGYTTFSTAMWDVVNVLRSSGSTRLGKIAVALAYLVLPAAGGIILAAAGIALAG